MNLPRRQQEILDQIERALAAADPGLKSMFAAFGRRTQGQPLPTAEALSASAIRRAMLICALLAVAIGVLVIGIHATSGDCPGLSSDQVVASAAVRHAGCTSATDAWSRGGR
jgi:hypothetical protein